MQQDAGGIESTQLTVEIEMCRCGRQCCTSRTQGVGYEPTRTVVLLSGPSPPYDAEGELMRFYLTYEGPVYSTQKDALDHQRDAGASHKHDMRRAFHIQLKQLWATNKFLKSHMVDTNANTSSTRPIADNRAYFSGDEAKIPFSESLANGYKEHGYRFAPLVCEAFSLLCSLRILFLRRDIPGSILTAGDIDNRLKTVIDALRRPLRANELVGNETPRSGEDPFFVLLEDDKQVTHLEVETDTLLDAPTSGNADNAKARLVIAVEIRPYNLTYFNLSFMTDDIK